MFTIIMGSVALIWAIVLFNVGFKVGVAIANRGKGKTKKEFQHEQNRATTSQTMTHNIAGMPAGVYYANQTNNWTSSTNFH